MPTRPLLSVIAPVFNEAELLPEFHARMTEVLGPLGTYELIFVNDGSTDGSAEALEALAKKDERVRVIHLSRNFGQQAAMSAGVDHADGDAVVFIDTDLQDPPELIADMVAKWREGNDVVYAQRAERKGESFFKIWTAQLFYKVMHELANVDIPRNVGDYRLIDRKVVLALRSMPERNRYMRGLVSWVGFKQAFVPFVREPRKAGETKYSIFKMVRLAIDGFTSFSHLPLKVATMMGLASSAVSLVLIVWAVVSRLLSNRTIQGWTSLMVVVLFLGGVQLLTLGILGEYVGRILDEVKARPNYLIGRMSGFAERSTTHAS